MKNNYTQSKNRLRYSFSKLMLTCLALFAFSVGAKAQTLNQAAGWPNAGWTMTGTYAGSGVVSNPDVSANFSYDDDQAGSGTNNTIRAESPVIDLTAADGAGETWLKINGNYVYRALGGDILRIHYWDADAATWNNWYTFAGNNTTMDPPNCGLVASYTTSVLNISTFTSTQLSGFKYRISYNDNSGWQWGFCLSAPTITSQAPPACLEVSSIAAFGFTSTSAVLSWTNGQSETSWAVEYGVAPYSFTGTPSLTLTTNPSTLTGLSANTIYQYKIRAICGASDVSSWSSSNSFTTNCGVVSTYSQSFDLVTTPALPNCFFKVGATGTVNTQTGNNNSAPNCLYIYATGTTDRPVLALPAVDNAGAGTHQLRFNARANFTAGGKIEFGYLTNPSSAASFISISTFTASSLTYNEFILPSGTSAGSNQVLAFRHTGAPANSVLIDDLVWEQIPTCPKPMALANTSVTATTATLSWTNGGTETIWEFEYGVSPYTFTGTPTATLTSNPGTLTGLTALTTYNVKIRANCGAGDFSAWSTTLTFTTLPTCPTPTAFAVSNITATSAALSWTNGGSETAWEVEYGVSPYTFTGTATTSTTVNPTSLLSLTPNTTYQVKIRANCGGGDNSPWSVTRTFTTPCGSFPTPTAVAEDFETFLPGCWTDASGTLTASSTLTGFSDWEQDDYLNNFSNGACAKMNIYTSGQNEWLISPSYDLGTGGNYQLEFNLALTVWNQTTATTLGAEDKLVVVISTDNGASWSNANALRTWNSSTPISSSGEGVAIDLSAYTGVVKFGFYAESTGDPGDDDIFIDDFAISAIPSCVKPTNINLAAITTNSATLNWTAPTSSTPVNYQWEVRSSGMPGSGATGLVTSGSVASPIVTANITGLSASTTYLVYLRSDCGAGDFSEWTNGTSLSTVCGIISSFPFTEDFENETAPNLPNCWSQNNNNADGSEWETGTTDADGLKCAVIATDFNAGDNDDYLILPQFNLSGNLRLGFSVATRSSGEPNDFRVVLSSTGNAPADFTTELMPLTVVSVTSFTAITPISLSSYSGNTYIAIHVPNGGLDGWELYIDDIEIIELNNDATLSSITPSDIGTYTPVLAPTFVSSITNYTVSLPFNPYSTLPGTSADVTATATNSGASVVITNAVDATTGTAPDNVATIVVTSSDGTTTSTYTVTYEVGPPSNDASLTSLVPSVGNLSPTFVSTNTNYTVTLILGSTGTAGVASYVTSNQYATVSVIDASDVTGATLNANTCYVTVTAEDGITQQQYIIDYYVATSLNSDATLSSISTGSGTLSPTFVSSITNYTVNLPVGTTGVATTTVITNDFYATYTITDATNVAGASPANVATIVVTAQDGATQTYTVTYSVTPPSSDATLLSLTTSQGTLEPPFSPSTLSYAVHLNEGATGVGNITGVVNNAFATITSDVDATNVAGAAPANTAQIVVTAQNGTTLTYIVVYDINTGIKNNNTDFASFSVVPNPTTGIATVNVLDKTSKNITISVVSISGQVISENTINTNGLEVNSTIDLSNQPKGVYFVKVVGEKSIQTKRVITY
ncbi:MAG: choice-of-anchor J domain-containing protein [Bacteroidota bacterium]